MTRHQLLLALLYFFMLLVVLPVFCSDRIYSLFYQEDPMRNQEAEAVVREARRRGVREYMDGLDRSESLAYHRSLLEQKLDNLVVVIAKEPQHEEDRLLSQLVTEVDRNVREESMYRNGLLVCNASRSRFKELDYLSAAYQVLQAENTTNWRLFNKEETMRHDFMDCLRLGQRVARFEYVTLIRDVVVPYPGFMQTLNQLLNLRIANRNVRGELVPRREPWLFLHLHEPVPFRHYELSFDCVWELGILSLAGGLLFYVVFRYLEGPSQPVSLRLTYTFYGALYFLTFALVIGRPYVTELRRVAATLHRVYDPPEPVHFSALTIPSLSLQPLLHQLGLLRCSVYSPFHKALDHMVNTLEYQGFVVSPSFVSYALRNPTPS